MRLKVTKGPSDAADVQISGERFVIGRDPGSDLVLEDEEVSRRHAALKSLPGGRVEIEDLDSRNGTLVDGEQLTAPATLSGGETIELGTTTLTAEAEGGAGETKLAAKHGETVVAPQDPPTPAVVRQPPQAPSPDRIAATPLLPQQPPTSRERLLGGVRYGVAALALLSAIALIGATFLDWFQATAAEGVPGTGRLELSDDARAQIEESSDQDIDWTANAWQSFEGFDVGFAVVAAAALALAVILLVGADRTLTLVASVVVGAIALAALVLIVTKVASPPDLIEFIDSQTPEAAGASGVESDAELGAYIGLFAAAGALLSAVVTAVLSVAGRTAAGGPPRPRAYG